MAYPYLKLLPSCPPHDAVPEESHPPTVLGTSAVERPCFFIFSVLVLWLPYANHQQELARGVHLAGEDGAGEHVVCQVVVRSGCMRQPCRIAPGDESRCHSKETKRGHSVAFLILHGSLYAVLPTSIYRCQTCREGSSAVFMLLMVLIVLQGICHHAVQVSAMRKCKYIVHLTERGKDRLEEVERGPGRKKRGKKVKKKCLIFTIPPSANLKRTTAPLPLQNPPQPTAATSGHRLPPKILPLGSCYLHIDYQKYLPAGAEPFHSHLKLSPGPGLGWAGWLQRRLVCFLDTQISQSTRSHSRSR